MEQQFTPLSTVNWGVSRSSSRMRKLKVLRASSANIGTTSMSSQSFAHSRLKMDEFNRYQVSNQNFKEKRLSEQESSLSNLRPMTGCQTDSSSKKISRKQQPYDRYQAYIEQNKAKYQTKSPDSKSINVKNRLLKSASARQMVPVRKSKSKMKLIKSGELMVMHQPREFEKIYGPELPKIQLSQQKIVKQKHDQIDKQKIKILGILSKELQSKFKRKSKKRLEEMHSLSDNESNFEQRIINQVYNRIEQTNQKREIAPQNINNNGNNLCIPGFYTNHIENLTINAGPAQLPMNLINNEVVSSITEDNKMMDVQDLNQDLQSTPNVLSQNSPQNENQLDSKSNSKAQKKTKILKFQRFVGSSSISHRNNTQNINSSSQTSQRKQEMESLDSEDAKILIKLKEDLKQMKRSASRSSQKGQTMKPEEKLQKLQSRMQKLREKSQELTEREVPVKKVSNTPRKSQVVEPFLNSLAPSNNKIPMKVPKNKLYKKFNTQNPKNIQLEMQIENENTAFFNTQNPKQETQIPQTPESSFLRDKNQEISEISSQLKSKESIISDKPLKIMVGELCDTDHNHEKTVPQNEEPQKLASPVNKQPTQLSVEMEIPEEKDQEDEDGFLQFQFDARTDFLSSSDDEVPVIEQSKDALSVSLNLEIKRNSHIIVKDTHLEKFTKFLDCFKIETKILFNDEKKINMSQINKIKSEFEEPEKTKKDISLEHKNKNLLNQVSKKISNFMPNPNYQLELFATYKHLNEKKQLFDIYSEYPKNLAKKLERFLNEVVTYDRSSKCKHSLNQYKIQLFMPISSRPQFKKVIDIYNINCFKQKSANRESVKKHKEFIIIDEKEEQERKNKNQSIIDIIQDYSQRSTFKIITDPNEERAFRLTVHYDTKFYIRTGRKKQKECRLKQIVCQYTNIGDNDCQQSNCHDDEVIQQYSVYADLNWKNKINSAAVITLTNAVGLDNVVENISLFDIKTKTNLFGIYNQFDWKTIEYAKIKFEKCQKQEKFHNHQLKNINMILNPCRTVQNFFTYAVGEIEVDFKTKYKHQDNISMQYKLKVGLCLKNMISYINQQIFDLSYLSIIQYQTNNFNKFLILK